MFSQSTNFILFSCGQYLTVIGLSTQHSFSFICYIYWYTCTRQHHHAYYVIIHSKSCGTKIILTLEWCKDIYDLVWTNNRKTNIIFVKWYVIENWHLDYNTIRVTSIWLLPGTRLVLAVQKSFLPVHNFKATLIISCRCMFTKKFLGKW